MSDWNGTFHLLLHVTYQVSIFSNYRSVFVSDITLQDATLGNLTWLWLLHHLGGHDPSNLGSELELHLGGCDSTDTPQVRCLLNCASAYVLYHTESSLFLNSKYVTHLYTLRDFFFFVLLFIPISDMSRRL